MNNTTNPLEVSMELPDQENDYDDELLTTEEVAKILRLTPSTLAMWRSKKEGPPCLTLAERVYRYSHKDLFNWIRDRRVEATNDRGN